MDAHNMFITSCNQSSGQREGILLCYQPITLAVLTRDVTVTGVAVNPDKNVDYNNYRFN